MAATAFFLQTVECPKTHLQSPFHNYKKIIIAAAY